MKTIKQLKKKIENTPIEFSAYPYGEKHLLEAQLKQSEDILKLIDKMIKEFKLLGKHDEDDMNTYHTLTELKQKITGEKLK